MSLNLSKAKGHNRKIIATLAQLATEIQNKTLRNGFVIAGELVAESPVAKEIADPYLVIAKRSAGKANYLGPSKQSLLHIGLHREALSLISAHKLKPILLSDAIIKKGTHGKDDNAIYVSMVNTDECVYLSVYHFKRQSLAYQDEYRLPPTTSNTYEADIHHILEGLRMRNNDAIFYWYGTARIPRSQNMKELDESILARVSPVTAITASGDIRKIDKFAIPTLLLVGMLGYTAYSVYTPYAAYQAATQELQNQVAKFPQEVVFSKTQLLVLDAKKEIMTEGEDNKASLVKVRNLMEVFARTPHVKIKSFTYLHDVSNASVSSQSGTPYNFEVVLTVPKEPVSMLEQSLPLLRTLSEQTGVSLRLATSNGFKEETVKSESKRIYRIQGTL